MQACIATPHRPTLLLVKSRADYDKQVNTLGQLAWQIAYTALWNGETFSAVEKESAIQLLKNFIREQSNPRQAYAELVQRILMARQYILTHPGTYAPLPTVWLNPSTTNGFAGTQRWYASLCTMRLSLPLYKMHLQAFGEAVLDTLCSNDAKVFHYWRSFFAEQGKQGMVNLFLSVVANASAAE